MNIFIAIILSYFLGALPFAFILVKLIKNIDLRSVGSGNIGATNAMRIIGFKRGLVALFLDVLKGLIPVLLFAEYTKTPQNITQDTLRLMLGIASICGHNWTIFLNFKGGKGIATSFGVLIGLAIKDIIFAKVLFLLALTWSAIFLSTGYVSLASIVSSISLPIFLAIFEFNATFACFGIIIAIFAIYRHKSNINRLLHHNEHRFNIKSKLFSFLKKALS